MINGETFLPVFLCLLSMSNNKRKSKKEEWCATKLVLFSINEPAFI